MAVTLMRLRRLMAQSDYLEIRERELREQVRAVREATDHALVRRGTRLSDAETTVAVGQALEVGNAMATLVLVRRQRARLSEAIARRSHAARRDLAKRRLKGS